MAVKIIALLILAVCLHFTVAEASECVSVDSFASDFAKEGVPLLGSKAAATKRMAKVLNDNKAAAGYPVTEISLFLFGPVTGQNGSMVVAATVDKAGCVNVDSVVMLTIDQFISFMSKSMSTSQDIIPLNGA